ncbi:MAG: 4Fe-4S binding protein [Candidatus Micrarchaeia archaeon]
MEVVIKPGTNNPTGSWRNKKPVVDLSKCTKCKLCETYCPDTSICVHSEGAVPDLEYCKGCGICATECPVKCIEMQEER